MKERIQTFSHNGRTITSFEYSGLVEVADVLAMIERATDYITSQPKGSVLLLTNYYKTTYTKETMGPIGQFSEAAKGIATRTAIIGVEGMGDFMAKAAARNIDREIQVFDNRQAALDWLVEGD